MEVDEGVEAGEELPGRSPPDGSTSQCSGTSPSNSTAASVRRGCGPVRCRPPGRQRGSRRRWRATCERRGGGARSRSRVDRFARGDACEDPAGGCRYRRRVDLDGGRAAGSGERSSVVGAGDQASRSITSTQSSSGLHPGERGSDRPADGRPAWPDTERLGDRSVDGDRVVVGTVSVGRHLSDRDQHSFDLDGESSAGPSGEHHRMLDHAEASGCRFRPAAAGVLVRRRAALATRRVRATTGRAAGWRGGSARPGSRRRWQR